MMRAISLVLCIAGCAAVLICILTDLLDIFYSNRLP